MGLEVNSVHVKNKGLQRIHTSLETLTQCMEFPNILLHTQPFFFVKYSQPFFLISKGIY